MTQQVEIQDPKANGAHTAAIVTTQDDSSRVLNSFASEGMFNVAQRMAKALSASSLLPETFRNNIPNCMIAMELANRIGCSVFMICQNMDVIHGRPGLRAQFLIATTNSSGKFSPIRYRWQGKEGTDEWGCRAFAKDLKSGEECLGPLITIGLAKAEGWVSKAGSKWKTIPELMLTYRAGAWWTRIYCPEMAMGMGTSEEAIDTWGESAGEEVLPVALRPGSAKALETALLGNVDPVTGEVPMPEEVKPSANATEREPGDE